jgi:hypothetical protein
MTIPLVLAVILINIGCSTTATKNPDHHKSHKQPLQSDTTTVYQSSTAQFRSAVIPDSVFRMTSLKHLSIQGMDCDYRMTDIRGNDVTKCWMIFEIPSQIRNLSQLETLQLNVNAIRSIPVELTELKKLRSLVLDDNSALSDISNLVKMENLEVLSLNGCHLSRLPDNIGQLQKLRSLGLAGNNFSDAERERIRKALPVCTVYY